jgi:hypothetical protein
MKLFEVEGECHVEWLEVVALGVEDVEVAEGRGL